MDSGGESEDGDEAAPVGKKDAGRGGEQSGSTGAAGAVEDKVYVPLDEGEELVHDSSAYCMYHAVSLFECAELSGQIMRYYTPVCKTEYIPTYTIPSRKRAHPPPPLWAQFPAKV